VKHPEKVNMVIFRENTEDIYAGIDFEAGKEQALKTLKFLKANFRKISRKSASAKHLNLSVSASSLCRRPAPNVSCGQPSNTPSLTNARASRLSTRATS